MPRSPRSVAAPPRTRTRTTSVARRRVSRVPTKQEIEEVVEIPVAVSSPRKHHDPTVALIQAHARIRAKNPRMHVRIMHYVVVGLIGLILFVGWVLTLDRNFGAQVQHAQTNEPRVADIIQQGVNQFQAPSPMQPIPIPAVPTTRAPSAFEQRLEQAQTSVPPETSPIPPSSR